MQNEELMNLLTKFIVEKKEEKRAGLLLVGIEGKGCSGKTRMSSKLKHKLRDIGIPTDTVSIDDFCNPRSVRYDSKVPAGLQVYLNNFNKIEFFNNVIKSAFENQSIEFDKLLLDLSSDSYTNRVKISLPKGGVLLVEGLYLLKEEYGKYFDFSVLLHISDQEQLKRALIRDAEERGKDYDLIIYSYKERYIPSYNYFLNHEDPLKYASVVVDYESIEKPVIVEKELARSMIYQT